MGKMRSLILFRHTNGVDRDAASSGSINRLIRNCLGTAMGPAFLPVTPLFSSRTASKRPVVLRPQPFTRIAEMTITPKVTTNHLHITTPLIHSAPLSSSQSILLKLDNLQPSGSFKLRGHGYLASHYFSRGIKHLVCSSGGNAGAAVAYSGMQLGVRVTIVVPETTPVFMIKRLREMKAEVIIKGSVWDVADEYAKELVREGGGVHVSPFDDPLLWEGHASIVEEIKQDTGGEKPAGIIVSVGGGGLFLGVAEGCRKVGWDDVPIITAETRGAESFAKMSEAGHVVTLDTISSIAKSLGALAVSEECVRWTKERPVISVVVSDREAVEAVSKLATWHRILVEPACGAAVAALADERVRQLGGKIVVVVCGGNMVSPELLRGWVEATSATEAEL